jgi:hypothetical protein
VELSEWSTFLPTSFPATFLPTSARNKRLRNSHSRSITRIAIQVHLLSSIVESFILCGTVFLGGSYTLDKVFTPPIMSSGVISGKLLHRAACIRAAPAICAAPHVGVVTP